jgi:hypothetical protein
VEEKCNFLSQANTIKRHVSLYLAFFHPPGVSNVEALTQGNF